MTAKDYLNQLYRLRAKIEIANTELLEAERMMTYIRGIAYDDVRVQTSPGESGNVQAEAIADKQLKLQEDVQRYLTLMHTIAAQISGMGNATYSRLLYLRYMQDKRLYDIADIMGYSYPSIKRLHCVVLKAFARKYLRDKES